MTKPKSPNTSTQSAEMRKLAKHAKLAKIARSAAAESSSLAPRKASKPVHEGLEKSANAGRAREAETMRQWMWAAAAAAQEAADQGVEAIGAHGAEAALARPYLAKISGRWSPPKKLTWATVAQKLWETLGVAPLASADWIDGGHYHLSPYHLRIVLDRSHYLFDVRGHETTDPNPKDFAALVEGVRAVGWVMQSVWFTSEGGQALVAEGRRRIRAARANNLRELAACSLDVDPASRPPTLIETIPANFTRDSLKLSQVKNGGNYLRSAEDVLRQLAGIEQLLNKNMSLVAIAAMMGVTTQTLANIRSLGGLSACAQETLRAGGIAISTAYRLSRELPDRQDAALATTSAVPSKSRQRAIEAFLAGENPDAEARAFRARDIKALGRLVAATSDPELAPLRSLFAVLRGDISAVQGLPRKWRQCLGLLDEQAIACPECLADPGEGCVDEDGEPKAVCPQRVERATQTKFLQSLREIRQVEIDDGVPEGMKVACPSCHAQATEYCLDGDDEGGDAFGVQEGTRIHRARIVAASRSRMPVLPEITGGKSP